MMRTSKVLVLGGAGMLGHRLFISLAQSPALNVFAAIRHGGDRVSWFPEPLRKRVITNIDALNDDSLVRCIEALNPDAIINCIGIVKQSPFIGDYYQTIATNSLLPHRLVRYARVKGARIIQISTDCVFDGAKGDYRETDPPAPVDLYGRSKLLGEIDYGNHLTIRTSMIGHELQNRHGLLEWFLRRTGPVSGYTRSIFNGFPTVELSRIIRDYILPHPELHGIYHLGAEPISKHDLLCLIAEIYDLPVTVKPEPGPAVDRSLNSGRFREATGYQPPGWQELIQTMRRDFETASCYLKAQRFPV